MLKTHQNFIVDRKGKRKAIILTCKEYDDLLEDLSDLAVVAERRSDKRISHNDFVAGLKKNGNL